MERFHVDEPICDLLGPILLSGTTAVCNGCASTLKRLRLPKAALANHIWLGEVPPQLKGLTFVGKWVVSRYRSMYVFCRAQSLGDL